MPDSFEAVAELAGTARELKLKYHVENNMHLVRFEAGRIEFRPTERAPKELAADLAARLTKWTGTRWIVSISNAPGADTLAARKRDYDQAVKTEIRNHPMVQTVLMHFPDAELVDVREHAPMSAESVPLSDDGFSDGPSYDGVIDPYEDIEDEA